MWSVNRSENQLDRIKEALVKFQRENDTKAACTITLSLLYSSGHVSRVTCHTLTADSADNINSYRLLPLSFMMRPRLRAYSMTSWRYLRPEEMWPLEHSLTSFQGWAHWYRLVTAFGQYCSHCVVKYSLTLYNRRFFGSYPNNLVFVCCLRRICKSDQGVSGPILVQVDPGSLFLSCGELFFGL